MNLKLRFFAALREQAKCATADIETKAGTPAALYLELQTRYGFTLPEDALRVAVNEKFTSMNETLCDQDTVVFITPVAGG